MPQIFHRSANSTARITIFGTLLVLAFVGWAWAQFFTGSFNTRQDEPREQPVPFSHQHHVGGLGVSCLYCHTSVEKSSFAGIPATSICMNCHRQIWNAAPALEPVRESFRTGQSIMWTRVHNLPDFVYFNHSIHVNKGVGCETCHGRVDQMPLMWQESRLTMSWCLDCHRQPELYVRPRDQVYTMGYKPAENQATLGKRLVAEYKIQNERTLTSCYTCHR